MAGKPSEELAVELKWSVIDLHSKEPGVNPIKPLEGIDITVT